MKTDRRTKHTKMVIRDAFLTLVKTKPIQKITIADICELADISRPTFYLHYRDIYALLDEIGENMLTSANLNEITKFPLRNIDKKIKPQRAICSLRLYLLVTCRCTFCYARSSTGTIPL